MSFNFSTTDTQLIGVFGVPATLQTKLGFIVIINGIIEDPPVIEDTLPGSAVAPINVRFFIRYQEQPIQPSKGDTLTIAGVAYNIFDIEVDTVGGAALKLRRT